MKRPTLEFLTFLFFAPGLSLPAFADSPAGPTTFAQGQPIESKIDLGFLGLVGGGMNYSVAGRPLRRFEDIQALIQPLHDEEASQLLRDSQDCHLGAWMLYVSGAAVGVDVGLSYKPVPLIGVDWFDRIVTGAASSEIFWALGALLDDSASNRVYNAIQRYNHLIQQKNEAFLDLRPQVCFMPQGFLLGVGRDF